MSELEKQVEKSVKKALEPFLIELEYRLQQIEKIKAQPNGNTFEPIDTRQFKESLRD